MEVDMKPIYRNLEEKEKKKKKKKKKAKIRGEVLIKK